MSKFLELTDLPQLPEPIGRPDSVQRDGQDEDRKLKRRVAAKFAEGDVAGAVREISSLESIAPNCRETLELLKRKHPPAPADRHLPDPPDASLVGHVATEREVLEALASFRPGSAGGPDGLRPGHLVALTGRASAEAGTRLLTALTDLINVALKGEVPEFATSTFYGANLCALTKRDGGIRPIAVGCTYRRLATKVGAPFLSALGRELRPVQLGFSTKGGCEAAVHAARRFLHDSERRRVFLKIDMRNAFNSLRRNTFLRVARVRAQELYSLLWQAYPNSSALFFGEDVLRSEEGIQQGDPFGPALFALGLDELTREVESGFNVWYLDDATLGGSPDVVLRDVRRLVTALGAIGLEINSAKCELTVLGHAEVDPVSTQFREVIPDVRLVELDRLVLLGAPVVSSAIPPILAEKMRGLERLVSRL